MKHTITPLLVSLTLTSYLLPSSAAVPLKWTVETSAANPATFDQFAGATYDLEATLQSRGKPLAVSGDPQLFWQTNGMGSAWWAAPATVSGNVLRATWTPACDVGAKVYNCFIGITGTTYNAAFQLRLRPSPGAVPNALPLPTSVIDFSKVTVLNPPWSGGVDTNAVRDIVRKTVDGAARMLPKYLWCMDFDDSYTNDAAWYYAQPQDYGSCSAVRDGGSLFRNYDWKFDDAAEFVVRMSAGPGRFASVGVANCGTNLTEEIVTSGKPSRYFKCLPGRTVDGVNANGVCAEVNVVGGDPGDLWDNPEGGVHPLAAVRWVLDNATSAGMAASNLAARIAFPSGWTQNFHWMVADERETWIVENGVASNVTAVAAKRVMTNFPILNDDYEGEGMERYQILRGGASITNAWWTLAYLPETSPIRYSDLGTNYESIWERWAEKPREAHRGESSGGQTWWQTVHTSVYDITNRVLRVAVQETPDWYTFAVPGGTGVSPVQIRAIVDDSFDGGTNAVKAAVSTVSSLQSSVSGLSSSKRDLLDLDAWHMGYSADGPWNWTSPSSELQNILNSYNVKPIWEDGYWSCRDVGVYEMTSESAGDEDDAEVTIVFKGIDEYDEIEATARRDRVPVQSGTITVLEEGWGEGLAKVDRGGNITVAENYVDYLDPEAVEYLIDERVQDLPTQSYVESQVDEAKAAANDANAWSAATYNFMTGGRTNCWFSGTNYVFGADAASRTRFAWEQGMDAATVPCSMALWEIRDGARQLVWDQRDWTAWYWSFKSAQMTADIQGRIDALGNAVTNVANYAWAKRYASDGTPNPDASTTFIDTAAVTLSPGMKWETVATVSGAAYWTIVGNGAVIGGSGTNAVLRIQDFEGNDIMTVSKGENRLAWIERGDITGQMFDEDGWVCFDMLADTEPTGYFSTTLDSSDFLPQTDPDCPAQYRWEIIGGGKYRVHFLLKPGLQANACFAKFNVEVEGQTVIRYNAGQDIQGGLIYNGVKIAPDISGSPAVGNVIQWKVVR